MNQEHQLSGAETGLDALLESIRGTSLEHHADALRQCVMNQLADYRHGDLPRWRAAVNELPAGTYQSDVDSDTVSIHSADRLTAQQTASLRQSLLALRPWRKGPYSICGEFVDTEWRSDWKWQRLESQIQSLQGSTVLDVGCGSGYHLWRMRGAGARCVIGIDPSMLFLWQFKALQHFVNDAHCHYLPLRLEQLCSLPETFDSVFSMGVLYHRRDPLEHLRTLRALLRPGGELILETLILGDDDVDQFGPVLRPDDRYARMRNVFEVPSISTLKDQLKSINFNDIRVISESRTTTGEQRSTEWMPFESLAQSLHAQTPELTVEGYPAPRRAVFLARRSADCSTR